ncbi:MAG: mechanosensitive ion channel family protein, partial [Polyangiaceae bacterium]
MFESLGSREIIVASLAIAVVLVALVPRELKQLYRWSFFLGAAYGIVSFLAPRIQLGAIEVTELNAVALVCGALSVARTVMVTTIDVAMARGAGLPINQLARDVIHSVVYALTSITAMRAAGLPPSSILTTGTVVTAIVGLALQETLGNLAAGISIQLEKPIAKGDWIRIDKSDPIGRVIEANWRAVTIQMDDRAVFVIPNSIFSKTPFTNYSRPGGSMRRNLYITIPHEFSPTVVHEALLAACEGVEHVVKDPKPSVVTWAVTDQGITYWLRFFIDDFSQRDSLFGTVTTRVWYQLHRAKIPFATPIQQQFVRKVSPRRQAEEAREVVEDRRLAIDGVDFLAPLPESAKQALAEHGHRKLYAPGEIIVARNSTQREFFMVRSGAVALQVNKNTLDTLGPGDCFGEMALLTGSAQPTSVIATCETQVLVIDEPLFRGVLKANPKVADEISKILAERQA